MDDFREDATRWVIDYNDNHRELINRLYSTFLDDDGINLAQQANRAILQLRKQLEDNRPHAYPIERENAEAFVEILRVHPLTQDPARLVVVVDAFHGEPTTSWRRDTAELLIAGTFAISLVIGRDDHLPDYYFNTLMHIAFSADGVSTLLRHALTNRFDLWNPRDPLGGLQIPPRTFDPFEISCIPNLQDAGRAMAEFARATAAAAAAQLTMDASGITSLNPSSGSSGDLVAINGNFSPTQPIGTSVYFPSADGDCLPAQIVSWSATTIQIYTPEPVGEGAVGFVTTDSPNILGNADPSAPVEFAGALENCLGPAVAGIAARVTSWVPVGIFRVAPCPSLLPNNENLFHGGPILDSLDRTIATERDQQPLIVTGRNILPSDVIEVNGKVCPTVYVNSTRLEFRLVAIPGGSHFVRIRRGNKRSNFVSLQVQATLDNTALPRIRPGSYVEVTGTGFANGMGVRINGEAVATVTVSSTYRLSFVAFRPINNPPTRNRVGELVTIEVFLGGSSIGTRPLVLDTFRIVIFGDSIMWGQGLLEADKFTTLVEQHVRQQNQGRIGVYTLDRLAHSGARILPSTGDFTPNASMPLMPGDFTSESPSSVPSIISQVMAWTVPPMDTEANDVDLVIIDGGINDVGVMNIMNPFLDLDDSALISATEQACGRVMATLLGTTFLRFPAPIRIIVTGYYQVVSEESDLDLLYLLLDALLPPLGFALTTALGMPMIPGPLGLFALKLFLRNRLITRSRLFATTANATLAKTVAAVPAARDVRLAVPKFGPSNAIFASDSYIFGVGFGPGGLVPEDPVAAARATVCAATVPGDPICPIASLGHPNMRGAMAYFEAIRDIL